MHCHRTGCVPRQKPSFVSMLLVGVAACMVGGLDAADAMGGSRRILVCGGRTAIVDITPDHPEGVVEEKEIVWKWQANVPNVHHFQVLAVDGVAVPWPPLR